MIRTQSHRLIAAAMINLSLLREMAVGASLPDAVVALGSLDIVVGDIDR